jgi:hypothetical protein
MLAYHGNKEVKNAIVARLTEDAKLDRIVHGQYWENGKGCAVGCTIRGSDHSKYETELGIPQSIARLEDSIFEGLSNGAAQKFPIDFVKAIQPGADLSKVTAKFLVWCLMDKKHGAIRQAPKDKFADCHNAIIAAAAVWQNYIKTGKVDKNAAASAAWSADSAESVAWRAAASAAKSAASAAWSADSADSAAWSADSAAWSAVWSAASAERKDFWKAASATLLKLLKAAR